jgi:hypothetical protein
VVFIINVEQGIEELEGDNEMQSSRSSVSMWIVVQPHRGCKEKL